MRAKMPIKPLQKTSLVDEVAVVVRQQIADGHIAGGETLRIEALARDFGISRTPIREAFSKLESEGLLVRKAGYAATVFEPTRDEVREFYEMRLALEPLAARLALPNIGAGSERRLSSLVSKMDDFTSSTWYGLNGEFHQVLYEPSQRPFLIATITNLIHRSSPYIRIYFKSHDVAESQDAHRLMLEAVVARDERALVAAIQDHLKRALDNIVAVIPS